MKKLMAIILTIAIVMSLCVVPASAADGKVIITITPDKESVDTTTGDVIVTYTVKAKVTDPSLKVGSLTITLDPSAGLTLAEKTKKQDSSFYYETNKAALLYLEGVFDDGVFSHLEYAPKTKAFTATGTTSTRNLNNSSGEVVLMTIMGKIAQGTTGSVTLKTTQHSYGDPSGATASVDCDVTPATVTILKAPISSVTFSLTDPTQGAALPSLSGLGSGYTGAVEWYEGTSATGTTATGNAKPNTKYTAKITLTAGTGESFADSVTIPAGYTKDSSSTNSKLVLTKTFDATGNLTPATVTAPTAKTGLEYNGTKQVLLASVATANGGTVQYSLDNSSWSTDIPTGTDAKTYTVYYKAVGDSTHSDSAVANIQVTIGPKDISGVTIGTIASQPYTGSAITPNPEVKDGGTTLVKDTDYTVSYDKNTNAGTATLTITGTGNYKGTNSKNFTIDPATQTLNVPGSYNVPFNKTFDLNTICSSNAPGATLKFALAPGASMPTGTTFDTATGKVKAGSNTGSFKVTVDSAAVPNYKAALQGTITVYIVTTPAASVTAAPAAKAGLKYNGNDQALVSKGTANGGTMQYSLDNSTWSNTIPTGKDAKTYTVYYKVKGDSDHTDYTPTSNTVSVSIAQKEVTVAPGTYKVSKEYDSTTTAGTGNGTLSVTGIVDSGVSVKATPVAYTGANVGGQSNVDVNLALSGTGNTNYKLAASKISVPCSITPATLTVNGATVAAKTYDGSTDATVSAVTFSGTKGSDALTVGTDYTVSGVFNSANVNDADTVLVTVTLKNTTLTKNYKLASSTYNQAATINQAPTPAAPTGLTGIKGNLLNTVALPTGWTWVNGTQKMEEEGVDKPFGAHYEDPNGNYAPNISGTPVLITVLAKNDVNTKITFPNGSLVYNGHGQEYKKATISGIIAGDTPSWTYTYAVDLSTATATLDATTGLPLTVGKYKVTAIYEDSANYGTATATLEITQATPTVTPKFDKITEKGQKLSVANLGIGSSSPAGGKIEWVNDAGTALPGDTEVEANKAYKWKYTPADTTNYAPVYGTIVVYPVSTGIVIYSPCYTIKASAGANGTISPAGWCSVVENGSQTFTFTPDKGYTVAKVLVDGKSVGAVKSYTFKDVTKDHTIEVIFMKSNGNPATGVFVMP